LESTIVRERLKRLLPANTWRGRFARANWAALKAFRAYYTLDPTPADDRAVPIWELKSIPHRDPDGASGFTPSVSLVNEPPRVTIVIPVHGHWSVTEACLNSLEKTEARWRARLVVVDDASPDDTLEHLRRFDWITVIALSTNVGYTVACNVGAADAGTDYVLMLNNDTEPLPGFLDALVELADADPSIGIVGSRLIYPDGRLQEAGGIVWSDSTAENYGRGRSPDGAEYLHVRDVDYCSGASILIRTNFFRAVGGYDERYAPAYFEDSDLAFAARAGGLRVVYQPKSVVIHHEGASNGTSGGSGVKRHQMLNRPKFREKWRFELQAQADPATLPLRVAARRDPRRAILYIDHQILTPERDSGSRRGTEFLRVLRGLEYEVVFAAENGDPFSEDADRLRQEGTMVLGHARAIKAFVDEEGEWLDCAFVARAHVAREWHSWLAKRHPAIPVVFDTVDLHHVRERRLADLTGSTQAMKQARLTEAVEMGLVRDCAATLVVSEAERDYLLRRAPRAAVFTVGNIHRPAQGLPGFAERSGIIFVGSFLHTPNVDGLIWFLDEVWPLLPEDIREAGFEVVGQAAPEEVIRRTGREVHARGWVPDIEPLLRSARISVAPLRYGAGVKGKVGEAWSFGLPVVGTTIAMEAMIEPHNPAHLVGDTPLEFARQLEWSYRDESTWRAASEAGLRLTEERSSPALAAATLKLVLDVAARADRRDRSRMVAAMHASSDHG
jgi:GT2 family glycosyltransferase